MAKRKRIFTGKTFQRWLVEGRGRGTGLAYKSWYTIQDISSHGLSHRIVSWTTGRECHLFSNLELLWFLVFDWLLDVLDIREQYPLLPLMETQAIAIECGVVHPFERRTAEKHPIPLTSDLRLTLVGPHHTTIEKVRTIKYARALSNSRTLEKLEIERRFYKRRGIDWKVLTDLDLPKSLARNVRLLHNRRSLEGRLALDPERLYALVQVLTERITTESRALRMITTPCDEQFGLEPGDSLTIVYYLLANRLWEVDMHQPINPGRRMSLVGHSIEKLNPSLIGQTR